MTIRSLTRSLLLLLFPVAASGCISVPDSLKSNVAAEGAHGTASTRIGLALLVRTVSYLPGASLADAYTPTETHCASAHSDVVLSRARDLALDGEADRLCREVAEAVDYVLAFVRPDVVVRYRIELYPASREVMRRSTSLLPNAGRVTYAFHWDRTAPVVDIVDTMAHETLHLGAAVAHLPRERRSLEPPAYLAGMCAQLMVFHAVELSRPNELSAEAQVPEGARASVAAGIALWKTISADSTNGRIPLASAQGERLKAHCHEALAGFFAPENASGRRLAAERPNVHQ